VRDAGMDDYFSEGRTGRLVPSPDPVAMSEAILELLADLANTLGES